ncbi:vesicular-fusion protein S17 [Physocladia obscura]|uniref:Vesicular-fusion protein S17 n=1 Tax=Physocladia obscura TaxID=109957 RepID=A0AAD5XE35_9FUNG|nr:vesicular-fusion protein S17 [Physocladia obscura]
MGSDPRHLIAEAEKKASAPAGWFGFGGPKLDEAAELYMKAGNAYKLQKQWKESGDAYRSQANLLIKSGERDEAVSAFLNAAKSYKKVVPLEYITVLESAVSILIEKGRFSAAASNQKLIAEVYETEIGDIKAARDAYEKAGEWYQGEEANASADGCFIKAATFAAQLEDFEAALSMIEDVASRCVDHKLTKWSLKEYFFKAGIILLNIGDVVRVRTSLERYCGMDLSFRDQREYKFILKLADAFEAGDVEGFTNSVVEFDRFSTLDPWKTALLLRVKKSIGEEDEDLT